MLLNKSLTLDIFSTKLDVRLQGSKDIIKPTTHHCLKKDFEINVYKVWKKEAISERGIQNCFLFKGRLRKEVFADFVFDGRDKIYENLKSDQLALNLPSQKKFGQLVFAICK